MPVPHQPPNNIPLASSLPKVSFRKIPAYEAQQLLAPAGVQDQQHINFGFNDGSEFERPEHYLRYVEPIDSELNKQVEYDMDEQDQEWLDMLNTDRRRDQQDAVSYEVFEIIIDRLEKEWFDLMKRIPPKPIPIIFGKDGEAIADGSEDIECAICDDGECENSNAIVFCDGCNLAVHQDCYGIPYIPEGQWLCRKCTVSPDRAVFCVLCPHEGGAFKQTTQGKWAHLLCAMWIPETGVSNPVYMEPIDSVERIPKARWKLQCYLCKHRMGACIQCDHRNCFTAFHVTCARRNGLLLKSQRQRASHSHVLDSDDEESEDLLRAWCHKHVPKAVRAQRARLEEENEEFQDASSQPRSASPTPPKKGSNGPVNATAPGRKKSARAYKKSYRAGPTLVPAFVLNRVLEHISKIQVRKKPHLTMQIAKFWSLKREARRGAPLLKRLHLEPWTATTSNKEQSDAERVKKLQFLLRLREDLEKVRMLAELVRKREKEKLRQIQTIRKTIVDGILFPYNEHLRKALEKISSLDRTSLYLNPVSIQQVPDYLDVIKEPMDWTTIANKIDAYQYTSVSDFKGDIHLVLDNAMKYNHIDTHYHRTAARIKKVAEPTFTELALLDSVHALDQDLKLEAEKAILELLKDYRTDEREDASSEPKNAVEEIVEQLNIEETLVVFKAPRVSAQSRKAAERAARSERSRLAFQRRKEAKEAEEAAEKARSEQDDAMIEEDRSAEMPRSSKRKSVMIASLNSIEENDVRDQQRRAWRASSSSGRMSIEREESSSRDHDASVLVVDQVNNHDSFKRFNSGWVLPEGTKRRRAAHSSAVDVNGMRLPSEQLASSSSSTSRRQSGRQAFSSDLSEPDSPIKPIASSPFRERPTRELRKARDSNADGKADVSTNSIRDFSTRGHHGRFVKGGVVKEEEDESDKRHKRTSSTGSTRARGRKSRNVFEPGTTCWAKLEGHPHFPAEIFDEKSDLVPQKVLQDKKRAILAYKDEDVHLVRFFDEPHSFAWIAISKLNLLFEDEELDEKMIKSCRDPKRRSEINASIRRAKEEVTSGQ